MRVRRITEAMLKENPSYILDTEYDSRNSFYNKARVDDENGVKTLYSYNTPVAKIEDGKVTLLPKWDYSATTLRHIKEFLLQNGFEATSKKQIKAMYESEGNTEDEITLDKSQSDFHSKYMELTQDGYETVWSGEGKIGLKKTGKSVPKRKEFFNEGNSTVNEDLLITRETDLTDFEFWGGARDRVKYLSDDDLTKIAGILEELYPEGMTETLVNDFFWFEEDTIAEWLGYSNFEELMDDAEIDESINESIKPSHIDALKDMVWFCYSVEDLEELGADLSQLSEEDIDRILNNGVTDEDIEKMFGGYSFVDDDFGINESLTDKLRECLKRMNEAEISPEDKADSDLIRSMIFKMNARANASFTPEEKAVMQKYGIERNNWKKKLSVDGRELNPEHDDKRTHDWRRRGTYSKNGDVGQINYADRARKLPQRKSSQVSPWSDNRELNRHSPYNDSTPLIDVEREVQADKDRAPVDSMKFALRTRNSAQRRLDTADKEHDDAVAKAKADYDSAVARAASNREFTKRTDTATRDAAQGRIDALLKREK